MGAEIGLALGAGALWLLTQLKNSPPGGTSASGGAAPTTGGVNPTTTSGTGTAADIKTGLAIATTAFTTIAPLVVKGVAAAGAASGGGSAAASSAGASVGAGAGGASGGAASETTSLAIVTPLFTAEGVGTAAFAGIIAAVIAAAYAAVGIQQNIMTKHFWEGTFLSFSPVQKAAQIFGQMAPAQWVLPNGQPLPAGWSTSNGYLQFKNTPAQLRQFALAALYLAYRIAQARNDGLVTYYSAIGWSAQQMAAATIPNENGSAWAASATPGADLLANLAANPTSCRAALEIVLDSTKRSILQVYQANGPAAWATLTAPTSAAEMKTAAIQLVGAGLPGVEDQLAFTGTLGPAFLASVEGFGSVTGGWFVYAQTIGNMFGWQAQDNTVRWVTNTPKQPYPLQTIWLVDSKTGNAFSPLDAHSQNSMLLSIKGAPLIPGIVGGPVAGLSGFAGPRVIGRSALAGFGVSQSTIGTSQCIDETTGQFVDCLQASNAINAARSNAGSARATALVARTGGVRPPPAAGAVAATSSSVAGLVLPALGIGAVALLLLGARRG